MIFIEISVAQLEKEIAELEREAHTQSATGVAASASFCLGARYALQRILSGGPSAAEYVRRPAGPRNGVQHASP